MIARYSVLVPSLLLAGMVSLQAQTTESRPKFVKELTEQWTPVPEKVEAYVAEQPVPAPSDALVLLSADSGVDAWVSQKTGGAIGWKFEDGVLTVVPGSGSILTKEKFGDCQIHLEWMVPENLSGEGQKRGNSGVYLQGRYEVQILDSYENSTYVNGQAGAIYKQKSPLVNPARKPGEWNTYDIIFMAPIFKEDGSVREPAHVTVLFNGVLVQNNTQIQGVTEFIGLPEYRKHGDASLLLQDHRNPIRFRNIWLRKI